MYSSMELLTHLKAALPFVSNLPTSVLSGLAYSARVIGVKPCVIAWTSRDKSDVVMLAAGRARIARPKHTRSSSSMEAGEHVKQKDVDVLAQIRTGAVVNWENQELGDDAVLIAGAGEDEEEGEDEDIDDGGMSPGEACVLLILPRALLRSKLSRDTAAQQTMDDAARVVEQEVARGRRKVNDLNVMHAMQVDAVGRLDVALTDATASAAATVQIMRERQESAPSFSMLDSVPDGEEDYFNQTPAGFDEVSAFLAAQKQQAAEQPTEEDVSRRASRASEDLTSYLHAQQEENVADVEGVRDGEEDYFNQAPAGFDEVSAFLAAQKQRAAEQPTEEDVSRRASEDLTGYLHAQQEENVSYIEKEESTPSPDEREKQSAHAHARFGQPSLPSISRAMAEVEQQLLRARVSAPVRRHQNFATPAMATPAMAAATPAMAAATPTVMPQPQLQGDSHLDLVQQLAARLAEAEAKLAKAVSVAAAWKAKCAEERRKSARLEAALHALTSTGGL
ncbi:hypothetical protein PPROV_000508500 [Pycnococcus provasolii]|uniref:Uncharacterized protein n=1 Tax=Pycnococcus provasolii TaxID=41880 RepID=A0A830HHL0_9CHLO|nr:hypothetical protein PPROV_000508500 [Pycnococcus provasolii]